MLPFTIFAISAGAAARPSNEVSQSPLSALGRPPIEVPGDSIVKLCPESRDTDLLNIERITNRPQEFYLDDGVQVFIEGSFTRDIPPTATVDYQISATANNGDSGALNGTFHICDWLTEMHQPPDAREPEKACPPHAGPVLIDYAWWLADWMVAPGQWSVKLDAKMPGGERIYCLQTEFNLQRPPRHGGPECSRGFSCGTVTEEMLRNTNRLLEASPSAPRSWPGTS